MVFPRCLYSWLALVFCTLGFAAVPGSSTVSGKELVQGYLVDQVCVSDEAGRMSELGPVHTRKCLEMPACIQGGYAILLPSNQVLNFDAHGNDLARKWLTSHRREKGIRIKASGTREGNTLHVLRIE